MRLDYDPFVSLDNSELVARRNQSAVIDRRTARTGTFLNWSRAPAGSAAQLGARRIVGAGRSLRVRQAG